ncbi:MarR family winged helix-turn-helix transcriptional regulator [Paracoccus sanguinis]|uniref:MarR family winged helix-turn-helix transcriptional regulator n=1 Tax=Paracoccus sanguinis TaxID=1545044 RepID=UPI00068A6AFD|nr:MarR family transcriptional regulator [Paracoccus sanguinis]
MSLSPLPTSLAGLLHVTSRALSRSIEERTRDRALSSSQWRLLVVLLKQGPMRQVRLAEALGVEPISVSRLVDRMVQSGWVERTADPDDRRAHIVHPTPRATASLASLGNVAEATADLALADFSPQERADLVAMLRRLRLAERRALSGDRERQPAPGAHPDRLRPARPGGGLRGGREPPRRGG